MARAKDKTGNNKIRRKREQGKSFLRKGDTVMVIGGGHKEKRPLKGQVGKIKSIDVRPNGARVIVEGLNLFVKHQRATSPQQSGGKTQIEKSMHISNVMYYVEKLKRPVRLMRNILADGSRVRGYRDPKTKKFVQLDA